MMSKTKKLSSQKYDEDMAQKDIAKSRQFKIKQIFDSTKNNVYADDNEDIIYTIRSLN